MNSFPVSVVSFYNSETEKTIPFKIIFKVKTQERIIIDVKCYDVTKYNTEMRYNCIGRIDGIKRRFIIHHYTHNGTWYMSY